MKFSIVIPNYNGSELLKKNLPHLLKAAKEQEVIVVDDASTDNSIQVINEHFPQVKLIVNQRNLRFAKTCNIGVENASGNIIVLLNTDVTPEENFLESLAGHFKDPQVFAVGCLEILDVGTRGKSIANFDKGLLSHSQAPDRMAGITFWAFGGSSAFDRKKWLQLGGLDHLFYPAYWEDIDLSYRAWKQGWKVLFEPKSRVHHQAETTNIKAFKKEGIKQAASKNQLLFIWKNIHDTRLILQHIFWLPIHFNKALLAGDSSFVIGSLKAFIQLPQALRSRIKQKKLSTISDRIILDKFISL